MAEACIPRVACCRPCKQIALHPVDSAMCSMSVPVQLMCVLPAKSVLAALPAALAHLIVLAEAMEEEHDQQQQQQRSNGRHLQQQQQQQGHLSKAARKQARKARKAATASRVQGLQGLEVLAALGDDEGAESADADDVDGAAAAAGGDAGSGGLEDSDEQQVGLLLWLIFTMRTLMPQPLETTFLCCSQQRKPH